MATVSAPPAVGQYLRVDIVDWRTYSHFLRIFAEYRGVRLAYDRGCLEIFRPLPEHEFDGEFLSYLIWALTEELGLPIQGGGSSTLRRRRKQRGIDPHRCFWIASEPAMRGKRTLDLRIDPPPDLVLEADVPNRSLDPMSIYASLAVPEVWRMNGQTLTFHALGPNRKYSTITHSLSFPLVTSADLMNFRALCATHGENSVVRQFRAWLRQRMSADGAMSPTL